MNIAVVGGGASGMMAAISAAQNNAQVTLFERNTLCGIKLNITGKGRCNVTNNCDINSLVLNTVKNGRFLYSAFTAFDSQSAIDFFEKAGASLKTERGNRVFPISDNAKEISGALKNVMHRLGVKVITSRVVSLEEESGKITGLYAGGVFYHFDKVILATGGISYPKTGSDGDGYRFAQKLGHTVTNLKPSLVALKTKGTISETLEGLSLKNVSITIFKDNKSIYNDFGEMVFTHYGVSGPMILSASAHLDRKNTFPYKLVIDLKPALDYDVLDKRILSDFVELKNKDFSNSLSKLLPAKIIPTIVSFSGIPADKKVNAITSEERAKLCNLLKSFTLEITAFESFNEAIITSGGVSVKEIDPKTMESKIIKGLYFCGEIIDVDAYTGGFNLQIAWSTGYCAGTNAAREDV